MTLGVAMFAFEGLLALLLVVTIRYAIQLRARIDTLRHDGEGLQRMISEFDAATIRAQASAAALSAAGEAARQEIAPALEQARAMRDELSVLIDRAVGARRGIDHRITGARQALRPPDPVSTPARWRTGLAAQEAEAPSDPQGAYRPAWGGRLTWRPGSGCCRPRSRSECLPCR